METFIYSANAVVPIFLVILLGWLLKHYKFINDAFISIATKLVFNIAIPCLLFSDMSGASLSGTVDLSLLAFTVAGTILCLLLLQAVVPRFIRDKPSSASFIQGAYRSNLAIFGIAIMASLAGSAGVAKVAPLVIVAVPMYNITAVLVLAKAARQTEGVKRWRIIGTNPLMIGALLGLTAALIGLKPPYMIDRGIELIGQMTLPLSLLTLGGAMELRRGTPDFKQAVIASLIKTVFIPGAALAGGYLLDFRGLELCAILVAFGSSTAVSSYPMAYQMGANANLSAQIVALSNLFSIFSMFGYIYAMRTLGLI